MIVRESAQARLAEQMTTERGPPCPVVDLEGPSAPAPATPTDPASLIINPYSEHAGHLAHSIAAGQGFPIEMVQAVLMAQHAHQQAIFTAHAASVPAPSEPSANRGTARSLPPTPLGSTLSPLPGSEQAERKAKTKGKGIDRSNSASQDDVAGMVPITPVFPPTPATPHTPAPGTPGYSPTEICASEAGEGSTRTAPYSAGGEDSDSDVDEIGIVQAMDEEGQWF